MSETDSFIDEVAEEVRRDRLFGFFRKYGWIPALIVILIVGGASWNEYRKATREAEAQRLGDAILTAMALDNQEARAGALADVETDGDAAPVLALVTAAAQSQVGDVAAADAALVAVANDATLPLIYQDLAKLKRLYLAGNGLEGDERAAIIDDLSAPGGAFRPLAEEQRALMMVEAGDVDSALAIFSDLVSDSESTQQLISRARQMIIVLGGTLTNG